MGGVVESVIGSNKKQNQTQTSGINFAPGDEAALRSQQGDLRAQIGAHQSFLGGLQNKALNAAPQLQTNAGLNTNYVQPQFQNGLDANSRALLSQQVQSQQNQLGAQQRQIGQQFRNNPVLAKILGSQAQSQAQLAQNPLAFQVQQGQDLRALQRAEGTNQALNQLNQALLSGGQFQNQALGQQFGLGQAARGEAAGFGQQSIAGSQQVFQNLNDLARLFGQQYGTGQTQSESKGILGQLFGSGLGLY